MKYIVLLSFLFALSAYGEEKISPESSKKHPEKSDIVEGKQKNKEIVESSKRKAILDELKEMGKNSGL